MIGATQTKGFLMSQFSWPKRDEVKQDVEGNNVKSSRSAVVAPTSIDKVENPVITSTPPIDLSTVTHDLSTPLGIIAGAAWSLKKEGANTDQEFWIDCILRNVLSAQVLLNDLKDHKRAEAGQFEVHLEKIDLSLVVRETVEDFKTVAKDHDVEFYGDAAWILGDAERIKRMVFNLLSNAAKYSEAGREIKVDVWKRGAEVCVFVQDQGRGVKPNEIERMFLPFTRMESDKNMTDGDGLGLASVKRIADAHGAIIKVQGTSGQGSIFEVTFKSLDRANV